MTGVTASPAWGSQLLATLLLLACVGAMAWMLIGERRRQRLRAWAARLRAGWAARRRPRVAPAATPPDSRQAQREAEALIERARRRAEVQREGNVLRPERFRRDADGGKRGGGERGDGGPDDPPRPTLH